MKRLLFIPLIFLCSALWAADSCKEPVQLARMNPYIAGAGVAAVCTSEDYIGSKTIGTTDTIGKGYGVAYAYTPNCTSSGCSAGNTSTGYLYHVGTSTSTAFLCVYTKSSSTPVSADTLIAIGSNMTTGLDKTWASASVSSSSQLNCGTTYWVIVAVSTSGANNWSTNGEATGTSYYKATWNQTSCPSTIGTNFTSTTTFKHGYYIKLAP